jgi:hypothetical protein
LLKIGYVRLCGFYSDEEHERYRPCDTPITGRTKSVLLGNRLGLMRVTAPPYLISLSEAFAPIEVGIRTQTGGIDQPQPRGLLPFFRSFLIINTVTAKGSIPRALLLL